MRIICSLGFVLVLVVLAAGGYAERAYNGPNSLGLFRIDQDTLVQSLLKKLGRPSSATRDTFCYQSQKGDVYLTITRMVPAYDSRVAGAVTLSNFRNCVNRPTQVTLNDLSAWKTEAGIGISSGADDVRNAYGKPSREDKVEGGKYSWVITGSRSAPKKLIQGRPELGAYVLIYEGGRDDLRIAEFGIRDEKVVWIFLSKNE